MARNIDDKGNHPMCRQEAGGQAGANVGDDGKVTPGEKDQEEGGSEASPIGQVTCPRTQVAPLGSHQSLTPA